MIPFEVIAGVREEILKFRTEDNNPYTGLKPNSDIFDETSCVQMLYVAELTKKILLKTTQLEANNQNLEGAVYDEVKSMCENLSNEKIRLLEMIKPMGANHISVESISIIVAICDREISDFAAWDYINSNMPFLMTFSIMMQDDPGQFLA